MVARDAVSARSTLAGKKRWYYYPSSLVEGTLSSSHTFNSLQSLIYPSWTCVRVKWVNSAGGAKRVKCGRPAQVATLGAGDGFSRAGRAMLGACTYAAQQGPSLRLREPDEVT